MGLATPYPWRGSTGACLPPVGAVALWGCGCPSAGVCCGFVLYIGRGWFCVSAGLLRAFCGGLRGSARCGWSAVGWVAGLLGAAGCPVGVCVPPRGDFTVIYRVLFTFIRY